MQADARDNRGAWLGGGSRMGGFMKYLPELADMVEGVTGGCGREVGTIISRLLSEKEAARSDA